MSVIPLLAASGTIFLDARAHKTIYDGCQVARARGAAVRRFRFEDPDHLDALLRDERDPTRLVCMDGVNSMTGNPPDLPAFAEVARRHGALLYVDDAHGFGVIGERSPDEPCPYGTTRQQHRPLRRRELRQHRARRRLLEGLLVAAGVHRLPDRGQEPAQGRGAAVPLLRARRRSPRWPRCSPASTSTSAAATTLRASCCAPHGARARRACGRMGIVTPNRSGLPIIEIPLRDHTRIDAVGRFLFDRGVYVTLAAYPLVPKDEVGFRVQLTAANTDAEVDTLLVGARGARRPRRAAQTVDRRDRGGGMSTATSRQVARAGTPGRRTWPFGAGVLCSTSSCRRSRAAAR